MGSRSPCFRLEATSARRSARCLRRSSCCRAVSRASCGSRRRRCLPMVVLFQVGHWYKTHGVARLKIKKPSGTSLLGEQPARVRVAIGVLLALIFSKYFYMASLSSYYTLYLIDRFHVSVQQSQMLLFVFLGSVAARHDSGRTDRRSRRPQDHHLGFDPGRTAVHADPAARESVLDGGADCADRPDPRVGLPGHRRVRAGADAGSHGHGRGALLWFRVRHGRCRRRRARASSRTSRALRLCIRCARSCRCSVCWPRFCLPQLAMIEPFWRPRSGSTFLCIQREADARENDPWDGFRSGAFRTARQVRRQRLTSHLMFKF